MSQVAQIPFILGMFTVSGSPAFPALVLDDEAAISIEAVAPLAARLGMALTGRESIYGLLQNWEHNFVALSATVIALDDAAAGKYFRSALTAVEFLTPCAPIEAPRQILCELTGIGMSKEPRFTTKLASTVVGPKAKIHLPKRPGKVVAEARIGAVIGQPAYLCDADEAAAAIAGYVTVTDVTMLDARQEAWLEGKSQPSFLPTGPYFVPRAFAGDIAAADINIAVNGEKSFPARFGDRAETIEASLARLSQDFQLFPGDILCCGVDSGPLLNDLPALGDGDIIETAVNGLGQQTLNAMRTSDAVKG